MNEMVGEKSGFFIYCFQWLAGRIADARANTSWIHSPPSLDLRKKQIEKFILFP